MSDLEDKVDRLQKRISYLERELDTSYDEDKFENRVMRAFPDTANVETRDGHFGYFARVTNIDGDDVQQAINLISTSEYEYAVTETASGLGMEVFTEGY